MKPVSRLSARSKQPGTRGIRPLRCKCAWRPLGGCGARATQVREPDVLHNHAIGFAVDEDGLAEPLGYVVLEVVAEVIGVPAGAVGEPLEAVGCAVSGVFGQLPAVFTADRSQQSTDVVAHPATRLDTPEVVAGAQEQCLELVVPDLNCMLVDHAGRLPGPLSPSAAAAHDRGAAREREHGPTASPLHSPEQPLNRENVKVLLEY
jgi:hypothetical protein